MNKSKTTIPLELSQTGPLPVLTFYFQGDLTKNKAIQMIEEWEMYMNSQPTEQFILIWEAMEMSGYEPAARTLWQKTLKDFRDRIDTIWLVSDKRIIRLGANLMGTFTKLNIKPVANIHEVKLPEGSPV